MAQQDFTEEEQKQINQGPISEEFPLLNKGAGEDNLYTATQHNAWIIIGRDHPAGLESGYGRWPKGKGGEKSSTIDIGVGRYSHEADTPGVGPPDANGVFPPNLYTKETRVGNNIQKDAARIYISQKTDIDDNFAITKAGTLTPAKGKSAIGLKADNIRFVSRESVKIVADCGEINSLGRKDFRGQPMYGIQLITGVDPAKEDVQSIVKSENLKECLEEVLKQINTLAATLHDFIVFQNRFNVSTANHRHAGHFRGDFAGTVDVLQSEMLVTDYTSLNTIIDTVTKQNIKSIRDALSAGIKTKYLTKSVNPKKYIGSPYNKTN